MIDQKHEEILQKLSTLTTLAEVENLRVELFGKKGIFKTLTLSIKDMSVEEKKEFGPKLNAFKISLEEEIEKKISTLKNTDVDGIESFKKSLPGKKPEVGHLHLITQTIREITDIFKPLGFTRVRYPEIDWEYFAFEALNIPSTHPARDEWETFFVHAPVDSKMGRMVITPHTSNGQVREMLRGDLPIRMLNISRCGRRQSDVKHLQTFYQFEGLVIDEGINITHLKGVLDYFSKKFYGEDIVTRLRPYDFRFTEPSFEVDIKCVLCKGAGCKFCKEGWVELGGAGMVHPNVLKAGGIDSEKYTGFAFGWGVERALMMKGQTNISDIRYLLNNDMRFLEQF